MCLSLMRLVYGVFGCEAVLQSLLHLCIPFLVAFGTQNPVTVLNFLLKLGGLDTVGFLDLLRSRVEVGLKLRLAIAVLIVMLVGQLLDAVPPLVKFAAVLEHHVKTLAVPLGIVFEEIELALVDDVVYSFVLVLLIVFVQELFSSLFSS